MSTYWDLKCVDCDEILDLHTRNHYGIQELIAAVPAIAAMGKLRPDLTVSLDQFHQLWPERCSSVDAGWCVKHENHKLVPFNEYGEAWQL